MTQPMTRADISGPVPRSARARAGQYVNSAVVLAAACRAHCGKISIFVLKSKFQKIPLLAGKFKFNVKVDFI